MGFEVERVGVREQPLQSLRDCLAILRVDADFDGHGGLLLITMPI
jgi:hypothetical protein